MKRKSSGNSYANNINDKLSSSDMQLRIKDMIASERPRERLLKYGHESLSNAELIGLILRTGTHKENAVTLANRLLKKFPLNELGAKRLSQFQEIKGIGLAKACQLIAAFELGRRCASLTGHEKISIRSSRDAANILAPEMEDLDKEHFIILLLDTRHNLIKKERIFIGTLDNSVIHPREIFKPAIIESSSAIIIAHNHPSGDPSPSNDDIEITAKLKQAGKLIGIEVLDHVIIGKNSSYSFMDHEMI